MKLMMYLVVLVEIKMSYLVEKVEEEGLQHHTDNKVVHNGSEGGYHGREK